MNYRYNGNDLGGNVSSENQQENFRRNERLSEFIADPTLEIHYEKNYINHYTISEDSMTSFGSAIKSAVQRSGYAVVMLLLATMLGVLAPPSLKSQITLSTPTATPLCFGNNIQLNSSVTHRLLKGRGAMVGPGVMAWVGQNAGGANGAVNQLVLGDDELSVEQNPALVGGGNFNFNMYGQVLNLTGVGTGFYVSSNGFITFNNAPFATGIIPQAIPNVAAPNNAIYILNTDLDPVAGGNIWWQVQDYGAGDQRLVITFENVPYVNPFQANLVNIQVIIYSNDGPNPSRIVWNIQDAPAVPGIVGTAGIENSCGSVATPVPGRNNAAMPGVGANITYLNDPLDGPTNASISVGFFDNAGLIATVVPGVNPPVGAGPSAINFTHLSPAVGNHVYTATVTYTYPCGVTETASGSLPGASTPMVVVALPTVKAITTPTPVCGSPTSTASVTPENGTNTYTWSSSVPANVTSFTPNGTNGAASTTIAWNNAVLSPNGSTFNIQLTEAQTIAPFCQRVQTPVSVTVYQTPATPVVTGAGIGTVPGALGNPCPLNATVYTQTATGGTSHYQWVISGAPAGTTVGGFAVSGGGVTVVTTANTVSITWGNTTTNVAATIVATASNGTGGAAGSPGTLRSCAGPNSAPTTVNINGVPAAETPTVNIAGAVCANDNRTYTHILRAGSSYAWSVTPGTAGVNWTITTGVPPNNNTATINWIIAGSYTVNCTETTAGGCVRVHNGVPVTVNPLPNPSFSAAPATGCTYIGGPLENGRNLAQYTFTLTTTAATSTYDWTVTNGIFVESGTSNRTGLVGTGGAVSSTVRWSAPGANTVTVTETITATGCARTVNAVSNVTASAVPRSITGPGYVTGVAANPCAGTGPHVYQLSGAWPNTNLFSVTMVSGGVISVALNPANGQFSVNYNAGVTSARIRVTETTAPGTACITEREFDITVNPLPTGNITPATTQVCNGNTAVFTFNATGGTVLPGATYSWTTTTPANVTYIGSTTNPFVTAQGVNVAPGTIANGNIRCTVTNPGVGGCAVQFNATLQVVPTPTAAAPTVPVPVCVGGSYNFVANGAAYPPGVTRTWTVTFTPVVAYTGSAVITVGPTVSNAATFNVNNVVIGDSSLANVLSGGSYNITTTFTDVLGAASCTTVPNVSGPNPVLTRPIRPVVDFVTPVCDGNYNQSYSITNFNGANTYQTGSGTTSGIIIVGSHTTNGTPQTITTAPAITISDWGVPGTKTVQIDAIDAATCLRRTVYTITVVAAPANPQPAPTPQTNACIDSQYFDNPVPALGAVNPGAQKYTYSAPAPLANHWYQWYVTNGFIVNGSNISEGTNTTATLNQTSVQVVWVGTTPGKVKYLVFTSNPAVAPPSPCFATSIEPNILLPIIPFTPLTYTTSIVGPSVICEGDAGSIQLSGSKVGLTYRVEEWNGATWSNVPAVAQVPGTGAAINFTIPSSVLTSVNPGPTCTHHIFRVTAKDLAFVPAGGACNWTRTSVTANVDYTVFDKPNNIPVVNNTPITCDVDNVTLTVGTVGQPSQPTVLYTLERSTIPAGVWTNIQTLSGNGGALTMTDNATAGIGSGNTLLNTDNYQYRVTGVIDPVAQCGVIFPPVGGCATVMTAMPPARIFANPVDPTVTFVPNPVCWESNITVNLASTQPGVRYEVKVGATSLSPAQYIFGDGTPKSLVFNSTLIQPTNPSNFAVINNVQVQALLISNATYPRPVPPSGCPANYGSTSITVNEKPVAVITGSAVACGPSTANYVASAVTPAPTSTFDWRIEPIPGAPAGTTPMVANNTGNLTVNPYTVNWGVHLLNCNGTYNPFTASIRMIATNAHGCTDTAFHAVTVQPTVNDAAISGDLQACIYGGFEAHLKTYTIARPVPCVFPSGTTFLWAMPVGTVSGTIRSGQNTSSIVAEWNTTGGTGIGTVTCTVTLPVSHGGCATVRTFDVQVYPLPVPVVNGPSSVCQNQAGTIYTADVYATDTYNWQVVGGTIVGGAGAGTVASPATRSGVNLNTITVNWLDQANPNAYVRLTQVSAVGCMNVTNFFVVVNPTPTPSINGADITCDNSVYTYSTANNAPSSSYVWSVTGNATITSGANQSAATVLTGAIGGGASFTLTLTETIVATTCTKTVNKVVSILQKPNPTITRVSPAGGAVGGACLNQTVTYGNSDPVAASPSYSYQWSVANGSVTGSSTASTVQVTWNTVGTGTVSLSKWHTGSQCTTSVSQTVTIVNPPAPAIAGPLAVCGTSTQTYSTPNVAGNTYAWSISANGTITSGGTTSSAVVMFNNPTPGGSLSSTISVVETNTLSGCVGNAAVVVAIRYQPQVATVTRVAPTGAANQACNNDVINYSIPNNTGSTYLWSVTGGTITAGGTTNSVTVMWTNVGTQTLSVVEEDATGNCSATSVLNVGVTYKPTPSISGNATPCTGMTYTYTTANVAGSTYSWSLPLFGGTITSGTTSNTITVEWTLSGARSVEVVETNGLCTATATLNVTVGKTPTTTAISRTSPVGSVGQACAGQTITYTTPNNGTSTYLWTVTGGTISGANNTNSVMVNWTVTGNQTLTVLETTTGTTCSKTATQVVAVEDQPAPTIAGPSPICSGNNGTYSVTAVPGHTYTWSISGGGTIISTTTASSVTVNWTTAGTFTVTVVQKNASGNCQATANQSVQVDQTPSQTTIAGATAVCNGTSQAYSVTSIPGQTYVWTVTGGNITAGAGTNAITVQWTALGSQTVSVNISTTGTLCSKSITKNVTVEDQPAPSITGATPVCTGSTSTYSVANVAGNTYTWSLGSGGTIVSGTTSNSIQISWTAAGTHVVTVVQMNATGNCQATATLNVVVNQTPVQTSISGPTAACNGSTQTYSVTSVAGQDYVWTVTGGTIQSGAGTNMITVKWTTLGNQSVSVMITTTGTICTKSLTQNVTVEDQPAPSISGATPVCTGDVKTYSTPAVAGHTYQWTLSGGGTIITSSTSNTIDINWTSAGTFTVSVNQKNSTGNCTATANQSVVVNQSPTQTSISRVAPTGPIGAACVNQDVTYNVTSIAGQTYVWTAPGGNILSGQGTNQVVVKWTTIGTQTLSVVITTTGTTCTKTLTQNVAVEFQPNPVITGPAVVCTGTSYGYSTPSNAGSSYAWTVTGGTITSGATSSAITVLWTAAGAQTVSVTETNATGNCFKSTTLNVSVGVTPTTTAISRISPAGNVGQACQGETITYSTPSNAGSSYLWTVTGGGFTGSSTTNQVSVTWNVLGTQTLTVVETTTGTNCSKTAVQNVSVTYKPTPNISGAFVVCTNKIHTYSTANVSGSTYQWTITPSNSFANIAGYPNSNSITVQWIQPGLHTMTLTETNVAGGCFTTVTEQIRVNDVPNPFITSTTGYGNPTGRRPGIVCANSNHTYSVTATPGNVFNWTVVGGSIITGQNTNSVSVTWSSAGMGTIACTETVPGSDCQTTKRDTIDIRPKPTPNVTGQINPCGGSSQTYTTPLVNGNSYSWTVVGGSFVQTAPNTIQVTWQSPVWPNTIAGSVSVTEWVTDVLPNQSCLTSVTLNTTVRPNPPVPTITGTAVICATDRSTTPATINVGTYTSSNPGSVSFNWTTSANGTIVGGQGSSVLTVEWANATAAPTTGSVSVTHTSTFGCTSSTSFAVTINPLPKPAITGVRSVCQNAIHTYSTPGQPGGTYVWTLTGGNIIRSGQGTPNITVEWTLPGTYTLTVTETNTFGCVVSNATAVTVNALPNARITASGLTTFCQGGDVTLTAPIGFSSYVWSTGETGRSVVVRSTGTYWVRVTDANGCSNSSDTVSISVFPSTLPIITLSGPTTFCEGGSVTLTAPAGFSAYLWSTGQTTQSIQVTKSGTYTVTIADGNGCTGTSTEIDVFVNPKPAPVLTLIGSTNICNGDTVEVRAPAGYVSYTWTSTTGATYPATRSIKVTTSDTVYCTVVDLNGCSGVSDTVKVKMNPIIKPVVTANGPTTFCAGNSVTLSAPTGYATYLWSNGATTREITVKDGGNYTVVAANQALCQIESSVTAVVVNELPSRPTVSRRGDTLTATSADADTYQWYRNGNVIAGAVNRKFVVGLPGIYNVGIADVNTCSSLSDDYEVVLTSVDDEIVAGRGAELRVFPNPTSGQFTVETSITEAGPVRIELVNAVGELVLTANEISNGGQFRTSLTMGELASGVYNVVVTTGNHRWTVRLVRQ